MKKMLTVLAGLMVVCLLSGCSSTPKVEENANGVVPASQWEEQYPDIYASFVKNEENENVFDHVEEYPMISTVYEGMAFSTYYNSARSHTYSLTDVQATGRPHALANCLTCKSADYTSIVNANGVSAYKEEFATTVASLEEGISCYNCHANDVSTLTVTHSYLTKALGADTEVEVSTQTCGQCHVEYYFDPETKEVVLPYTSIEEANPDDILAYFNTMGFADYTNPRTGTKQIKVQHPEFETYNATGSVHAGTYTCADCHMGTTKNADGEEYTNHNWTSPLDNDELVQNSCAQCHSDLETFVKGIQNDSEARVNTIGKSLEALTNKLADAVASGNYTDAELDAIRAVNRDAQFYWDFVFVENSEGAHNSRLTKACLDKAETLITQANGLFK